MADEANLKICLIGVGAIGISFAALHLRYTSAIVSVYDPREDLESHINSVLPGYIDSHDSSLSLEHLKAVGRLRICPSLEDACADASIVQEQGPENLAFKQSLWPRIEKLVDPTTHLWSSTSGIAASLQSRAMQDRSRLLVVHPFNPPHIMPLIEIVPSPDTKKGEVDHARDYFAGLGSGHRPVVIQKEVPGFVGNRLAFTLFREACYLVGEGVVSVEDLDTLVEASLGPRWAVQGPFKSYNMGGSTGGIQAFFKNLSGTMQNIWDSSEPVNFGAEGSSDSPDGWQSTVVRQTQERYGPPNPEQYANRDEGLRKILEVQKQLHRLPE